MNNDMIRTVWFLYRGLSLPTGFKPSGKELAAQARKQAIQEVMYRSRPGTLEKQDIDANDVDPIQGWQNLAEQLERLSDPDAYALFIRAREYGHERR